MALPRFAVVDVETSGLSSRRHHVLQVGVVMVEPDGSIGDEWSTLVRLRRPWSRVGPRRVHGITRRSLHGAPRCAEVVAELARRLDGAVFVAHNATFDAEFLERAAHRCGVALDLRPRLDTLWLSRWLDPDRQLTHGLTEVSGRYGITITRRHDALEDARATALVLPHLLAAHGIDDDADLAAVLDPDRRSPRPVQAS
ncbi:MAG: 3'-5' exonuclease [Ilumatobacteraceae bacterium]